MAAKLLKALSYEQAQRFCNAPVGLTQHAAASTPCCCSAHSICAFPHRPVFAEIMLTACATMHMQGRASCFNRFAQTQLASLQLALPNVFQQQACCKLNSGALSPCLQHQAALCRLAQLGQIPHALYRGFNQSLACVLLPVESVSSHESEGRTCPQGTTLWSHSA